MKDLQTLLAEATKLNREIGRILKASTFSDYSDLSELDIDTRDGEQIFLRDQLYHIMDKLADVQSCIDDHPPEQERLRTVRDNGGRLPALRLPA